MMNGNRWFVVLRRIVACILFTALFLSIFTFVEKMLVDEQNGQTVAAHESVPPNSVDVAFIGSSHIYDSIIPQKLMDDYGIASVNAASSQLQTWQGVYELEWLLQKQNPQLIVLDLYALGAQPRSDRYHSWGKNEPDQRYYLFLGLIARAIPWENPLKYSVMFREASLDTRVIPYLTTMNVRHSSLWDIGRDEMLRATGKSIFHTTFNYYFLDKVYPKLSEKTYPKPIPNVLLNDFERDYLLSFFRICKEKDIRLLITAIPHWPNSKWLTWVEEAYRLAEQEGVDYVDMDTILQGSGFDFQSDMADIGHTNIKGAQKVTSFLGEYIKEHYDLPDRRENDDPRYDAWKRKPYQYIAASAGKRLRDVENFDEWVDLAGSLNEDYLMIFTSGQAYEVSLSSKPVNSDLISLMKSMGLEEIEKVPNEDVSYLAIFEGARVIEEQLAYDDLDYAMMVDDHPLTIRSNGILTQIKLDNKDIACEHEGLKVILYSKVENKTIKSACLDLRGEGIAFVH